MGHGRVDRRAQAVGCVLSTHQCGGSGACKTRIPRLLLLQKINRQLACATQIDITERIPSSKPTGDEMEFDDATIRQIFGTDTAEDDDPRRLKAYFFKNKTYENIRADLPLRILVGHKGIGKSALLRMSHLEDVEQGILSLEIQPNDLVIREVSSGSFIERIDAYKRLILKSIAEKSIATLSYGEAPTINEAVAGSARHLMASLVKFVAAKVGHDGASDVIMLRQSFLREERVRVYLDDLDRGWSASQEDIHNISALINAARDICNDDPRIQIRTGLRSDAYYLYRTSDESTDKVEGNVIRLMWNRHDILTVMALRVATYLKKPIDGREFGKRNQAEIARELHPVLEEKFTVGRGHWDRAPIHIVLLSLNRNRPRDLIKLLTEAAREAYRANHDRITASDLEKVFSDYSHGRITDLILEFKSELPDIEKLLYNMRPAGKRAAVKEKRWLYTNDELIAKLRNILQSHNFAFTSKKAVTPSSLAEFLYKIDFLVARDEGPDGKPRWTQFDQNRILQSQFVDFGYKWEVHPAYRWALQPKSINEILEDILPRN